MTAKPIIGDMLIVLAAAFTVYLCVVMARRIGAVVLKGPYRRVFRCELIACALFLLFALDVRFDLFTLAKGAAGRVLRSVVTLAVAALLFFFGKISVGSFINTAAPAPNAIVLGLALENGRPTGDLLSRLDAAGKYLRGNPEATLILTGGNPDASGRTEAAAMRELLIERGVAEEKMVLEDRAEDTKANFRNTAKLVDPGAPIVLITSNYHMDRAVLIARSAGFKEVLRLPAPSSPALFGANVMWEVVLELNELTLKHK